MLGRGGKAGGAATLPQPRSPPAAPHLSRAGDHLVPQWLSPRPPCLTAPSTAPRSLRALPPPAVQLRLRGGENSGCTPAPQRVIAPSCPSEGPLPHTPRTGSCPTLAHHVGDLGSTGHSAPSAPWGAAGRWGWAWLLDGVSCPRPCGAEVGLDGHQCLHVICVKILRCPEATGCPLGNKHYAVWSPDPGPECGLWSSPCASRTAVTPQTGEIPGGGPAAPPVPQMDTEAQDSRSRGRPSPAPLPLRSVTSW